MASPATWIEVDGRLTLPFEDGEGQRLVLVDDGGIGYRLAVGAQPGAIRTPDPRPRPDRADRARDRRAPPSVLTEVMNMRRVRDYVAPMASEIHVFAMGEASDESNPAAELHVIEDKDFPVARQGAGGVHHVAFRTPDETQYHAWTQRLNELARASTAARSTGFIFAVCIFANPTASCSRLPPTVRVLRPTSRWPRSARNWRCRHFSNRGARRSRRG